MHSIPPLSMNRCPNGIIKIRTPILEEAGLFRTSLGDDSDVVSSELFQFADRNGSELALRPEGTAGNRRFERLHYAFSHSVFFFNTFLSN